MERQGGLRAARKDGKTDTQAQDYLLRLFRNVSVQDKSARDALNTFLSGKGDVLLTYENEARLAERSPCRGPPPVARSTVAGRSASAPRAPT